MINRLRLLFLLVALLLAGTGLTGCSATSAGAGADHAGMPMAPLSDMPAPVRAAPVAVQQAYQFAAANPHAVQNVPCYCGCGAMGHTSNYACYVKSAGADGKVIEYDDHALACSICVDITQDVMRLQAQGKTDTEIRAYIDGEYAQYGPSNMK